MAGNENLVHRIEQALSCADKLADIALDLNEGMENAALRQAIRAYVKAARGLDLRSILTKETA